MSGLPIAIGKRLVKAPKVYLRDSGLLHHLLNLSTLEEVRNDPVADSHAAVSPPTRSGCRELFP